MKDVELLSLQEKLKSRSKNIHQKTVKPKVERGVVFRNKSNTYCISLLLLLFLLPFLSCSKVGSQTPVVIGINPWTGYDPLILAESKNLFQKNNVNVEIKRYGSAQEEMQAMRNGVLYGAALTMDEAVSLHESGCPVKAVLVIDYSMGGDMLIGQKSITDMQSLKAKKIGYEGTVVGEFLLQRALKANNIKEWEVKLIEVKAENWLTTFREHGVDAMVCYNPTSTILLNRYEGNLLFSSKDIPFEIIDILVFSESFFHSNKSAIVKVAKTWFEALEYINGNPDEASEIITSEKQITLAEFKQGLSGLIAPDLKTNKNIFNSEYDNNIYKYSQVIIDFMMSEGLLSGRLNTDDFFDSSIVSTLDKL
ncbi:MAG: ABC transporter substrate-binding protein [Candidatus Scalindua sp.]|nr:ABC transporter substrate-binding protein [Candidatus Scalindua sp.]